MRRTALLLVMTLLGWSLWGPGAAGAQTGPGQPAAGETIVYGKFRQSPQGGIVLESPDQPGVVYVPFDPAVIMEDMRDILVKVRGEVRATFVRDGTTYRVLAVAAVKPMTAEYGATRVTDQPSYGLPGTDPVQIHAYHDKTCYLYARFAVLERLSDDTDGHSLRVMARNPGDDPAAVCEHKEGTPLFKIPNGGDFSFAGASGDRLFVVNGPGGSVHGLMAVDLDSQKQVLSAVVVPGAEVSGRGLRYREVLPQGARHPACPQGATAVRPMLLDLATGTVKQAGKPACWP